MKLFYKPGCLLCHNVLCMLVTAGANVELWNIDSVDGLAEFADVSGDFLAMPVLIDDNGAHYAGHAARVAAECLLEAANANE